MGDHSRRGFLKWLAGATTAAIALAATDVSALMPETGVVDAGALDLERLLWRPGQKTIFLPAGDIAVRNIREATAAEIGQILGKRMVRIRHSESITMMTEEAFAATGHVAFPGTIDVHFDDGTIAHNFNVRGYGVAKEFGGGLEGARAKAQAHSQDQRDRKRREESWKKSFGNQFDY